MEKVIEIFKELQNNSGKKLQEILQDNYYNELLQDVLYFIYNPYITTGLSKKKINKKVTKIIGLEDINYIGDIFDYLIHNSTGRDYDIAVVQNFINKQNPDYKETYEQIFTKELKLGITAKTINKVWHDLIPEFNVMLAEKYWDRIEKLEQERPNIILTQKLDGIRCVGIVEINGEVKLYSRQGKQILGLKDIESELGMLLPGCYDGELLFNDNTIPSKDLYRATVSIVNSTDEYKQNIIFNIFDWCAVGNFPKGIDNTPCEERKRRVNAQIKKCKWLKPVPILYKGEYNKDIVQEKLNEQIALEHEGIMVNIAGAVYEAKRTKNILKVKAMQDCDLKIIGFEEGTGKNKETLGAIIVNYKGFQVKVGSGLTDEDREYIWKNQNDLFGTIIELQYFEETTNKKDNSLSLRFPVFLRFREDKTEESYY